MKFNITKHAKERYFERIHGGVDCHINVYSVMLDKLKSSKNISNNIFDKYPRFILYLYEKYHTANIVFLESKDKNIFVCKKRKGTENLYDVITCYKDSSFEKWGDTCLSRQDIFIKISLAKKKYKNV